MFFSSNFNRHSERRKLSVEAKNSSFSFKIRLIPVNSCLDSVKETEVIILEIILFNSKVGKNN